MNKNEMKCKKSRFNKVILGSALLLISQVSFANCVTNNVKFEGNKLKNNGTIKAKGNFRGKGTMKNSAGLLTNSQQGVTCTARFEGNVAENNGKIIAELDHSGTGTSSNSAHLAGSN